MKWIHVKCNKSKQTHIQIWVRVCVTLIKTIFHFISFERLLFQAKQTSKPAVEEKMKIMSMLQITNMLKRDWMSVFVSVFHSVCVCTPHTDDDKIPKIYHVIDGSNVYLDWSERMSVWVSECVTDWLTEWIRPTSVARISNTLEQVSDDDACHLNVFAFFSVLLLFYWKTYR